MDSAENSCFMELLQLDEAIERIDEGLGTMNYLHPWVDWTQGVPEYTAPPAAPPVELQADDPKIQDLGCPQSQPDNSPGPESTSLLLGVPPHTPAPPIFYAPPHTPAPPTFYAPPYTPAPPTFYAPPHTPAPPTFYAPPDTLAPPTFYAPPITPAPPTFYAPPTTLAPPTFYAPPHTPAPPTFYAPPTTPAPPTFYAPPHTPAPPTFYAPPTTPAPPTFYAPPTTPAPPKPYVKKPPNSFMIFRKEQRPHVVAQYKVTDCATVNKILGQMWNSLSDEGKEKYRQREREDSERHYALHPAWMPNKSVKKRKSGTQTGTEEYNTTHNSWKQPQKRPKQTHNSNNTIQIHVRTLPRGFLAFMGEQRPLLAAQHNITDCGEATTILEQMWNSLTDAAKQRYFAVALMESLRR